MIRRSPDNEANKNNDMDHRRPRSPNAQLSGTLSTDIGQLASLTDLRLGPGNKLTGPTPFDQLTKLAGLRHLDLFNNTLTGVFCAFVFQFFSFFFLCFCLLSACMWDV